MRGQQDRDAAGGQAVEQQREVGLHGRIETGHRLVQQQHVRLHRQHAGDADALFLAEAEVVHGTARVIRHVDGVQCRRDAGTYGGLVEAEIQRAERHVFLDERREQLAVRILEHEADAAPQRGQARTAIVDGRAVPQHLARGRAQQAI